MKLDPLWFRLIIRSSKSSTTTKNHGQLYSPLLHCRYHSQNTTASTSFTSTNTCPSKSMSSSLELGTIVRAAPVIHAPPVIKETEPSSSSDTNIGETVTTIPKSTKPRRVSNPIVPNLTQEQINNFSSVLSIHMTGNRFSWCLIERTKQNDKDNCSNNGSLVLKTLNVKIYNLRAKMHYLKILNQIKPLVEALPPCQLLITEEYPTQLRAPVNSHLNLEVTNARAMFLGHLASQPNPPHMISIKTVALAKLFCTFIGSEKVSGRYFVQDVMENGPEIKISDMYRNFYITSDSSTKEYLSNAFLLNLAYWTLTKQFDSQKLLDCYNHNNNNGSN